MRIVIKNIPKDRVSKAEVKEATEYFLTQLIGKEKVKGLGRVEVGFRKMNFIHGGSAKTRFIYTVNQRIVINSRQSKQDIFKVLAHECTHVKQYFLKELTYEIKHKVIKRKWGYPTSKRQKVTIWKGKRILRSNYRKRPWEVEARKYESLANNLKNKLEVVVEKAKIVKELPDMNVVFKDSTERRTLALLKEKDLLNGELVNLVTENSTDKQYKIKVLKEVYAMKELGIIEEYCLEGIVWVRKK